MVDVICKPICFPYAQLRLVMNDDLLKRLFQSFIICEGLDMANSALGRVVGSGDRFFAPRAKL